MVSDPEEWHKAVKNTRLNFEGHESVQNDKKLEKVF